MRGHSDALDLIRLVAPDLLSSSQYRLEFYGPAGAVSGYAALWLAYLIGVQAYGSETLIVIIGVGAAVAGAVIAEPVRRWYVRRREQRLVQGASDPRSPIQGVIIQRLRERIGMERDEALGPASELEEARRSLRDAHHEASRAVLYWLERRRQEPNNKLAESNLDTAQALRSKFAAAVAEIDKRTDALRSFLDHCEAKIATLKIGANDIEQTQRLAALAVRADSLIDETSRSVSAMGAVFVAKATTVAQALGSLERTWLRHAAGELPLDHIDKVADEILQRSVEQERDLQQLESSLVDE